MAKKNIKFPNISRIINDRNFISIFIGSVLILIAIGILSFDLRRTYYQNKSEVAQKQKLLNQQNFWINALNKYSDYRDGYLALAKVDYELNEREDASKMVNKALSIDPNYQDGISFRKILQGN